MKTSYNLYVCMDEVCKEGKKKHVFLMVVGKKPEEAVWALTTHIKNPLYHECKMG
jgi:hypothetical protein